MTTSAQWPPALLAAAPALLDDSPDGFVVVDTTGAIMMANRQLLTMLGYGLEELIGRPVEVLLPEGQRAGHEALRDAYIAAPVPRSMGDPRARLAARHRDGHLIPVEIALSPVALPEGQVVAASIRDISRRLAIEAQLDSIRRSLDIIDHGVLLVRPDDLAITYANAGAAYQTGIPGQELTGGMSLVDVCTDLDQARIRQVFAPLVSETVQSLTQITRFSRRNGTSFPVELTLSYPPVTGGLPRPVVALVRNISDRIRTETERDRREQLLRSLGDIRRSALAEVSVEEVLVDASRAALDQLEAGHALIASTGGGQLWCRAMATLGETDLTGAQIVRAGALEQTMLSAEVIVVDGATDPRAQPVLDALGPLGPTLFVPLVTDTSTEGVLIVVRPPGADRFTPPEISVAVALAGEAAITLLLHRAREDRRYLAVVEDRERIARDLHDLVIQRLFATGMALQAALGSPARLEDRATVAITELDETIAVIRRAIFALTRSDQGLRAELERLIDRHRAIGRNHVELEVCGDVEVLPPSHQAQLIPTLNELLSNVERHANAELADARLEITPTRLMLTVVDDGEGMDPGSPQGYGLRNLQIRAQMLGGALEHRPGPGGIGTEVVWSVPLEAAPREGEQP